ncbi:MAG: GGDEF domain-containing protein [Deltaproteobacteria bacterium]|nr:GGDEF domain-containing protein [Deltaproteobacteria bacterium]
MNKTKTQEPPTDQTVVTQLEKIESSGEKHAYILFLSGPLVGKLHQLNDGETILGRAQDSTIAVEDNRISRHHISITLQHGETSLKDLGSTNGTFVNGKRIQSTILKDGDKIQLSSTTVFKFAYQDKQENIFHKELYKMAVIDTVTGIFNKRYLLDRLKEEFSHSKRANLALSLIMMDIDHFKKINDTHGHLAGDFALAHLAATIKPMLRQEDIFARYGGEEFVIILRGAEAEGALQLAERIRTSVEKSAVQFEALIIPMTISLGIATLGNADFKTPEEFIAGADHYLYESKEGGRNRTSCKKA